jgi:hypothetical protein
MSNWESTYRLEVDRMAREFVDGMRRLGVAPRSYPLVFSEYSTVKSLRGQSIRGWLVLDPFARNCGGNEFLEFVITPDARIYRRHQGDHRGVLGFVVGFRATDIFENTAWIRPELDELRSWMVARLKEERI